MFKEKLENIIERTEGAVAALIMGADGIEVEKVLRAEGREANLDVVAAEFASLVRSVQRTGGDIGLGSLRELNVVFDGATFVIRLFNRDYFVVLALEPEGNFGRGRFELRKTELELSREFAL
ncbi:MAG: roadblock/LC7 domain-containing protein [Pyrinomonadaceae bacterium]|nr:roadblock/LC7 domain-containing protein [Pyrinomonadaceae bacterium]